MENKLLTIFNTYGKSHQVSKLLEEAGEFIEALNDVKNKKIYTQERDILERIYKNVDENIKRIIRECWR